MRPIKSKRKGQATLGSVPVAHKRLSEKPGMTIMAPWDPKFRPLDPGDGSELISYEGLDDGFAAERRRLVNAQKRALDLFRWRLKIKTNQWKDRVSEEKRKLHKMLTTSRTELQKRRVKYQYAVLSMYPRLASEDHVKSLKDFETRDSSGAYTHGVLSGPKDFQSLLKVAKYTLNLTFHPEIRNKDNHIIQQHDNIPKDDRTYPIREVIDILNSENNPIVGWVRYHTRFRKYSAKELKRIQRAIMQGKKRVPFSLLQRDMGLVNWLAEHPRPSRGSDPELRKLYEQYKRATEDVKNHISFQRTEHTKVVNKTTAKVLCDVRIKAVEDKDRVLPVVNYGVTMSPSESVEDSAGDLVQSVVIPTDWAEWQDTPVPMSRTQAPSAEEPYSIPLGDLVQPTLANAWKLEISATGLPETRNRDITLGSFWPAVRPQVIRSVDESRILPQLQQMCAELEGAVFSGTNPERLNRSVSELKDLPQTGAEVEAFFYNWLPSPRHLPAGAGAKLGEQVKWTVRVAAKAYLWWKFGFEPLAHDVNTFLSDAGKYISALRRALSTLYNSLEDIQSPRTFKRTRRWALPGPTAPYTRDTETGVWVFLPCFPLDVLGRNLYGEGWRVKDFGDIDPQCFMNDAIFHQNQQLWFNEDVAWIKGVRGTSSSKACPNGTAVLNYLLGEIPDEVRRKSNSAVQYIRDALFADGYADPLHTTTYWRTLTTKVFARFSSDELRMAFLGRLQKTFMADLFDDSQAITTTWELLPLSFILDWFLSVKRVMQQFDLELLKMNDAVPLRSETGVWYGHQYEYWNTVQPSHTTLRYAAIGTFDALTQAGIPGIPGPWRDMRYQINARLLPRLWAPYAQRPADPNSKGVDRLANVFPGLTTAGRFLRASHAGDMWVTSHVPILALLLTTETWASDNGIVCGKGTSYQRAPNDEQLLPLRFVPTLDVKLTCGKVTSLAALLLSTCARAKGAAGLPKGKKGKLVRLPRIGKRFEPFQPSW